MLLNCFSARGLGAMIQVTSVEGSSPDTSSRLKIFSGVG
jgi:hypothetical protein